MLLKKTGRTICKKDKSLFIDCLDHDRLIVTTTNACSVCGFLQILRVPPRKKK